MNRAIIAMTAMRAKVSIVAGRATGDAFTRVAVRAGNSAGLWLRAGRCAGHRLRAGGPLRHSPGPLGPGSALSTECGPEVRPGAGHPAAARPAAYQSSRRNSGPQLSCMAIPGPMGPGYDEAGPPARGLSGRCRRNVRCKAVNVASVLEPGLPTPVTP